MGVIATGGGFFAYFSTMWYYGFQIHGMFTSGLGVVNGAWRCQYKWDDSTSAYLCMQGSGDAVAYDPTTNVSYSIPADGLGTLYYGNQIAYLSFNSSLTTLGNPFLFTSNPYTNDPSDKPNPNLSALQAEWIKQSCLSSTSSSGAATINNVPSQQQFADAGITEVNKVVGSKLCPSTNAIDWLYMKDFYFDLRQVIVQFEPTTNQWVPMTDVFGYCQNKHNSAYSFNVSQIDLVKASHPKVDLTYASTYNDYLTIGQNSDDQNEYDSVGKKDVVVCYSTEALKYAQTAYFIAIVVVQWSNILSCKCKKMPFIYSPFNSVMMYGIALETAICIILAYIPGV